VADRIPQRSVAPYPVHLDLRGRTVLLVGAGKVAARRIDRFLRAGARVVVVAPDATPAIRKLAARRRGFVAADVRGMWLVHAATDNPAVNRAVLAAVRAIRPRGIPALASAADASWPDGDLVIPASFERDGLVVSVGTRVRAAEGRKIGRRTRAGVDGQSGGAGRATRSRDAKNLLARQLAAVSRARLIVVGAERGRLGERAFAVVRRVVGTGKGLAAVLSALRPVDEFLVVVAPDYCAAWMLAGPDPTVIELARHAIGLDDVPAPTRTVLRGAGALDHVAGVVAATRSAGPGAPARSRGLRRALLAARASGTAGPRLAALLRPRDETRSR